MSDPTRPLDPNQPPYAQPPYGQAPPNQPPYAQPPYGQAPPNQPPYAQPPYGQAPYSQQPYVQVPQNQQFQYVVPDAKGALASLGKRLGAMIIDSIFLWILYGLALCGLITTVGQDLFAGRPGGRSEAAMLQFMQQGFIWFMVASLVISTLYFVTCYSTGGKTLGKKMVGIRVVRKDGQRLSLETGLRRTGIMIVLGLLSLAIPILFVDLTLLADLVNDPVAFQAAFQRYSILSNVTLLIQLVDYLWALRNPERQSLHDVLAGTVVIND